MSENRHSNAFLLGFFIFLGLSVLGYLLGQAAIEYRLYDAIDETSSDIKTFLIKQGISETSITFSAPAITDKIAQRYDNSRSPEFRYSGFQTVTVYSNNIAAVHSVMGSLSELGKKRYCHYWHRLRLSN